MKFFCEYCGCRIDSNNDDKCPNCGASYKQNESFIKQEADMQARKDELQKAASEIQGYVLNGFRTSQKVGKVFVVIFIVVFVITLLVILLATLRFF